MRHCAFCGTEVPEYAQFCGSCGRLSTLSGEWPKSPIAPPSPIWSSEDDTTIIDNTSLPTLINEQPTIKRAQQEERTRLMPNNNAIWMPPIPQKSQEEEEQDRMRRAMVWDTPLLGTNARGPSGAPVVQGTPQLNSTPSVSGTPQLQSRAGESHYAPASYQQTSQRTQLALQGRYAEKRVGTFGMRGVGGAAMQWIIVVVTALLVLTSAGVGVALAVSPSLSLTGGLSGKSVVVPGQHLSLHGSGFLPGGHITLKRDGDQYVQIAAKNAGSTSTYIAAFAPLAAVIGGSRVVSASGTFDAIVVVGKDWHQGNHTIYANEDVFARSATMSINVEDAPSALSVSPASLDFGLVQKGTKTTASLLIGNTGGKPLAWTAYVSGAKWLRLDASSGNVLPSAAPGSLSVFCDTTSLALGTYSAFIHVHAAGGTTDVTVLLRVVAQKQAKLAVSPGTLDFQTMDVGQQATKVLSISNTGTLVLNWQVTSSENWVVSGSASGSIQPGSVAQSLDVEVDTTSLQAGSYSATLTISSNGGNTQVTVFLVVPAVVLPTPTPTATPIPTSTPTPTPIPPTPTPTATATMGQPCMHSSLDFGTVSQGQVATLPLAMGNCGGTSFTWRAQPGNPWVSIDNSAGTLDPNTTVTLNVSVDTTTLGGPGTYNSSVIFYTSSGNQTVTITVTIPQPQAVPTATPTPTPTPPGG